LRFPPFVAITAACLTVSGAVAQSSTTTVQTIATVPLQGVTVSGLLSVADGRADVGNNGTIAAGDRTAHVALARGGSLDVCASTKIHLTRDSTNGSGSNGALMIAIDRGAMEAHYTPGQYSDVLLTPDLRILISGPGEANLSLRVNQTGDACLDNHGDRAPYVLVSNVFDGGAYRVQPNQRVLFEGGSLRQVVDHETEPCGCPAEQPVSGAGASGEHPAKPGQRAGSNVADDENPFPLAESEGLKAPPGPATKPEVPPGTAQAQVEAPVAYDSANPALPPEPTGANRQGATAEAIPATAELRPAAEQPHPGFFHHVGHFFKRLFGR
jgi:hypothetical protein